MNITLISKPDLDDEDMITHEITPREVDTINRIWDRAGAAEIEEDTCTVTDGWAAYTRATCTVKITRAIGNAVVKEMPLWFRALPYSYGDGYNEPREYDMEYQPEFFRSLADAVMQSRIEQLEQEMGMAVSLGDCQPCDGTGLADIFNDAPDAPRCPDCDGRGFHPLK